MIFNDLQTKNQIFDEFLNQALIKGWNQDSLNEALEINNIDKTKSQLVFENGLIDLTSFFIEEKICGKVRELIEENEFKDLNKINSKISFLLTKIFEFLAPNQAAMVGLSKFFLGSRHFSSKKFPHFSKILLPKISLKTSLKTTFKLFENFNLGCKKDIQSNNHNNADIFLGFKLAYIVSDEIWSAIGDQSTDFNYYSKRLILTKIILRSFAVFINDDFNNLSKTKSFIEQQISMVVAFAKIKFQLIEKGKINLNRASNLILNQSGDTKSCQEFISSIPFIRLLTKAN